MYLVERATDASAGDVHEQEIGAAVFGRSPDYDTSTDNIVRVNVYDLRKRLEKYFSSEGQNETVVIDIPKGGYCPEFLSRGPAPAPGTQPLHPVPWRPMGRIGYIFLAITVVLSVVCVWLAVRNSALNRRLSEAAPSPGLQRLWSRMFTEGRVMDVVIADSNLSFLQDALQKSLSASDYFQGGFLSGQWAGDLSSSQRRLVELFMSRRYTSMADVHVLQRLSFMRGSDTRRFDIYFARDFSAHDLKTSNVVLLGSKRSNPWVEYFENGLSFRIDHDETSGYGVIVNEHPRPGEQARYATVIRPPMLESFGVVAFVPNLVRTGNVLILEGAGMHATEAAGELVTQDDLWAQVLRALHVPPAARLPYFEVLFRTSVLGATMQPPQIVAVRTRTSE